jgi:hypothetical protein
MKALGLPTERTRTGWEVQGISRTTLRKFSRRTALIEETATERGATDPAARGELGAKTRERKQKDLPLDALQAEWRSRITDEERDAIQVTAGAIGQRVFCEDGRIAGNAVTLALDRVCDGIAIEERLASAQRRPRVPAGVCKRRLLRRTDGSEEPSRIAKRGGSNRSVRSSTSTEGGGKPSTRSRPELQ